MRRILASGVARSWPWSNGSPAARPSAIRRSRPVCSATYMTPRESTALRRNAMATGLDNPETTGCSCRRSAARSGVGGVVLAVVGGRVDDVDGVDVVGADEIGAVDGSANGLLLLHAPSETTPKATIPTVSFRIEPRLEVADAYD